MSTDAVTLELDLDVFAGPFDLLLSLILRDELDLLEVELADVVLAYLDHLGARDELDLESATEFLVLIAALLELKSRLMLPGEEIEELEQLAPAEAAEELLERLLAYARFRGAGAELARRRAAELSSLFRSAPL
ncbi:MAG: segregation/condensation protein A, partial [Solirubrobacterales bacterium]|nr:segregation/condensation protein A [Solirubrobacterales bacterium]